MKMPQEEILHVIFCHSSKCLKTLAELNSSRYPKEDPHLGPKNRKISGKVMKMPQEEILHVIFCHSSKCLQTLAELNSSRYPKENPHL